MMVLTLAADEAIASVATKVAQAAIQALDQTGEALYKANAAEDAAIEAIYTDKVQTSAYYETKAARYTRHADAIIRRAEAKADADTAKEDYAKVFKAAALAAKATKTAKHAAEFADERVQAETMLSEIRRATAPSLGRHLVQ